MFRNIFFSIFMSMVCSISAQKPQTILSIAKENKPIAYYQEQSQLWQKELKEDIENGEAWQNYYKAERAIAQLSDLDQWANDKTQVFKKLDPIIKKCQSATGNSFDYYYLQGMNTIGDRSTVFFEKAYAQDKERSEVHGWLFSQYVPKFKTEISEILANKMLKNNAYSNANLMWNYNAIQSAEPNSIFITNGDMDCIPKWVLQYGNNLRTDVLVISKWLLMDNLEYRREVFNRIKCDKVDKNLKDFKNASEFVDYLTAHIIKNSKRPVYMSSGTDMQFFKSHKLENDMYVVGAAIKYETGDFDNLAATKYNFEQKYQMEYLFNNFQYHPQDEMIKTQMNLTYLPALFSLKEHYTNTGNQILLENCDQLIDKIATDSGRKATILSWFDYEEN